MAKNPKPKDVDPPVDKTDAPPSSEAAPSKVKDDAQNSPISNEGQVDPRGAGPVDPVTDLPIKETPAEG
jgi:hypothetical protein